jgi:hypothetical protein
MELQKLNVKIFTTLPDLAPLTDFIDVFHGWIQASDGDYHDVADYSHMTAGAGIVLIANDAIVSIDENGGRRGLLYNRKTPLPGSNQEKLRDVVRAALQNCQRLEKEAALKGKIRFSGDEVWIAVNDRLAAPNAAETFQELKPELEALAARLFNGANAALTYKEDSRKRLSVAIRTFEPIDLARLIANVAAESQPC